jgi:hypothetical protein
LKNNINYENPIIRPREEKICSQKYRNTVPLKEIICERE